MSETQAAIHEQPLAPYRRGDLFFKRLSKKKSAKPRVIEMYRKKFHAPCDKIYVKGVGNLDLSPFIKFKSPKPLGFIRGFGGIDKSHRFVISDVEVFVYQNKRDYQVQFNPSHFKSYQYMDLVLRVLLKEHYDEAQIFKTHLFVDIKKQLKDVYDSITVKYKRQTTKYKPAEFTTTKSGRLDEASFTLGVGSNKTDCIKVYNSTTKHGLPDPSTRIERQYNNSKFCPIHKLEDLPKLIDVNPFTHVTLHSVLDTSKLKGEDLTRFKLLDCMRRSKGLHAAMAELRKDNPKDFNREYRQVLALLENSNIDLISLYKKKMSAFLKRPMSKLEIAFLKDLGVRL